MLSFSPEEEDPPESNSAAVPDRQTAEVPGLEGATWMFVSMGPNRKLILLFVSFFVDLCFQLRCFAAKQWVEIEDTRG